MPDFHVVMVEPSFEESIGFVARAMKNFGLSSLHLVNPIASLGRNGRMRGGHAQEILDTMVCHDSLPEALNGLDLSVGTTAQKGYSSTALLRKPLAPDELVGVLSGTSGTVGIVLGREGTGLNNQELGLCDTVVTIPASDSYPTLNISHAAAIVFYELHKSTIATTDTKLASENVRLSILKFFSESLARAAVEEYKIGLTVRALRNVMARSAIRHREASLLAGAMRNISEVLAEAETGEDAQAVKLQLE